MAFVKTTTTIKEYQDFVNEVYGLPNERHFNVEDMLINIQRFTMRGLKGIRKKDKEKTILNFLIALSWFTSVINHFRINVEEEVWKRFPYACSYCGVCPCNCAEQKIEERQQVFGAEEKRPKNLDSFQHMFKEIYPPQKRNLEQAGIHLAEELGEFSEAILTYRGAHKEKDFNQIPLEAADLLSCFTGVFNSLEVDMAKELAFIWSNNCHICHNAPCICDFVYITNFKS